MFKICNNWQSRVVLYVCVLLKRNIIFCREEIFRIGKSSFQLWYIFLSLNICCIYIQATITCTSVTDKYINEVSNCPLVALDYIDTIFYVFKLFYISKFSCVVNRYLFHHYVTKFHCYSYQASKYNYHSILQNANMGKEMGIQRLTVLECTLITNWGWNLIKCVFTFDFPRWNLSQIRSDIFCGWSRRQIVLLSKV